MYEMIKEMIKEDWLAFYILGLSILTAIGKIVIRKWDERGEQDE